MNVFLRGCEFPGLDLSVQIKSVSQYLFYFTVEFDIIRVLISLLFLFKIMMIKIIFVNWVLQFCLWAVDSMVHDSTFEG